LSYPHFFCCREVINIMRDLVLLCRGLIHQAHIFEYINELKGQAFILNSSSKRLHPFLMDSLVGRLMERPSLMYAPERIRFILRDLVR
jgi:hypothetical protein